MPDRQSVFDALNDEFGHIICAKNGRWLGMKSQQRRTRRARIRKLPIKHRLLTSRNRSSLNLAMGVVDGK